MPQVKWRIQAIQDEHASIPRWGCSAACVLLKHNRQSDLGGSELAYKTVTIQGSDGFANFLLGVAPFPLSPFPSFLSSPFPYPLHPFLFLSFPLPLHSLPSSYSLSIFLPPLRSRAPLVQLEGLGSAVSSPIGYGWRPCRIESTVLHISLKIDISWQQFSRFFWESTDQLSCRKLKSAVKILTTPILFNQRLIV